MNFFLSLSSVSQSLSALPSLPPEGSWTRPTFLTALRWCAPTPSGACGASWSWRVAGGVTSWPPCSLATCPLSGPWTTTTASSSASSERTCPSNSTDPGAPRPPQRDVPKKKPKKNLWWRNPAIWKNTNLSASWWMSFFFFNYSIYLWTEVIRFKKTNNHDLIFR